MRWQICEAKRRYPSGACRGRNSPALAIAAVRPSAFSDAVLPPVIGTGEGHHTDARWHLKVHSLGSLLPLLYPSMYNIRCQ